MHAKLWHATQCACQSQKNWRCQMAQRRRACVDMPKEVTAAHTLDNARSCTLCSCMCPDAALATTSTSDPSFSFSSTPPGACCCAEASSGAGAGLASGSFRAGAISHGRQQNAAKVHRTASTGTAVCARLTRTEDGCCDRLR